MQEDISKIDYKSVLRRYSSMQQVKDNNKYVHNVFEALSYDKRWNIIFGARESRRMLEQYEDIIGTKIRKAKALLDIGCGTGNLLIKYAILNQAENYFGCDISIEMLRQCRKNSSGLNKNIFLITNDVEMMPFKNESFDFICGHAILHHTPEPSNVLLEIYRLMNKDGFAIISGEGGYGADKIITVINRLIWFIPRLCNKMLKKTIDFILYPKKSGFHICPSQTEMPTDVTALKATGFKRLCNEIGFSTVRIFFTGFSSSIFFWALQPVFNKVAGTVMERFLRWIQHILDRLDRKLFTHFIPKDWYHNVIVYLEK